MRSQASHAIEHAVIASDFTLKKQCFSKNVVRFKSWEQYEHGILNVTHTDHQPSAEQHAEVKRRFLGESDEGFVFEIPNRVDLLQKV